MENLELQTKILSTLSATPKAIGGIYLIARCTSKEANKELKALIKSGLVSFTQHPDKGSSKFYFLT